MNDDQLKAKIAGATREQLVLMLYDGAMRFAEECKDRWARGDDDGAHDKIIRAQNVVLELLYSLDRKNGGTVAENLAGLFTYCYQRLVQANLHKSPEHIDECNSILKKLREAWAKAIEDKKAREGRKE